jgi:hypothetical protein
VSGTESKGSVSPEGVDVSLSGGVGMRRKERVGGAKGLYKALELYH